MKNWATNKSSNPNSSSPISSFFPVSWFFKSKKKGGNSDEKEFEFAAPKKSSGLKEGRFYSMDEDDYFWRLSFGDEIIQGRKSTGGINDHEIKLFESPFESTKTEIRRSEECRNFNEMVSDIKKIRENRGKQRIVGKTGEGKAGDSTRKRNQNSRKSRGFDDDDEEKISNFRDLNDQTSRKSRGFDENEEKIPPFRNSIDRNSIDRNSRKFRGFYEEEEEKISTSQDLNFLSSRKSRGLDYKEEKIPNLRNSYDQTSRRSRGFDDELEKTSTLQEKFSNSVSEWLEIEGKRLKEIKIKSDSKKKSATLNRGIIKPHSPRTECKIRALEDMKKTRTKTKKKEQVLEGSPIFDSFAVVKSSYNPQQDFRESMVEMIRERGIEKAEDLEELLACYLTLNCDEYHDLIIKVFRQVWFELKEGCVYPSVKNGLYFDDRVD